MTLYSAPLSEAGAPVSVAANPPRAYFFVSGLTSTDLLPRVLAPFLKLGLTPYRIHASCEHGSGTEMTIELRFDRLSAAETEALASRCRSIIGVRSVLTTCD